jgi:quercetin dioxygenase-like cupin family protein
MIEEREGWHVINVREARWYENAAFGMVASFEKPGEKFPETGVHLFVLEPGKPNCRYHREGAQEDFLVLAGECLLLVNGEERKLGTWDYVHCPAGVTHVFVGAGEGPCALLAIGHRPKDVPLFYPESELAKKYGAEAPEPTPDPKVAYSDVAQREEIDPPAWPL